MIVASSQDGVVPVWDVCSPKKRQEMFCTVSPDLPRKSWAAGAEILDADGAIVGREEYTEQA